MTLRQRLCPYLWHLIGRKRVAAASDFVDVVSGEFVMHYACACRKVWMVTGRWSLFHVPSRIEMKVHDSV